MFARTLLRLFFLVTASSLAACHLYIDDGDQDEDRSGECYRGDCSSSSGSWPDGGVLAPDGGTWDNPQPQSCIANYECGPGCYCNPAGLCEEIPPPAPDAAPFGCGDLSADEDACTNHEDCTPVYRGTECTASDGSECTSASADCTCESFQYDYCESAEA